MIGPSPSATYGKILAARDLRLPVALIARPATESADAVETVEAALDCVSRVCALP